MITVALLVIVVATTVVALMWFRRHRRRQGEAPASRYRRDIAHLAHDSSRRSANRRRVRRRTDADVWAVAETAPSPPTSRVKRFVGWLTLDSFVAEHGSLGAVGFGDCGGSSDFGASSGCGGGGGCGGGCGGGGCGGGC